MQMRFLHYENIWRGFIGSFGMNGLNNKRMGFKEKAIQQKRGMAQLLAPFLPFLVILIFNRKQFEEDLVVQCKRTCAFVIC